MKRFSPFIIAFLIFNISVLFASEHCLTVGSNIDPQPQFIQQIPHDIKNAEYIPFMDRKPPSVIGQMPYEMKDRVEDRTPFLVFDDCSKWVVESTGATAFINKSQDQRMFNHDSAELTFLSTDANSTMTVRVDKPIDIPEPWDCISMWIYGNSWIYGEAVGTLDMDLIILDAEGKESYHRVPSYFRGTINYRYWWLLRVKIHQAIPRPAKLVGFKFSGTKITFPGKTETIYLGPCYAYKDNLKPLVFDKFPDKFPFPTRSETILPVNKTSPFVNTAEFSKDECVFTYKGKDCTLEYYVDPKEYKFDSIRVSVNGKTVRPCAGGGLVIAADNNSIKWEYLGNALKDNRLVINWQVDTGAKKKSICYRYYITQKSLILEIEEDNSDIGIVKDIQLGRAEGVKQAKLFRIPMLNFNFLEAPRLLYSDGLFFFTQFDWYYSQASLFYAKDFTVNDNNAVFNGGALYNPKTDGIRNSVRERLFINVSPDVQEVLPTIPNPKSPMRPIMCDKAWMTINCGGMSHEERLRVPRLYRNLGMEKVAVRYHEGVWRDGGESFTFRTDASPYQGGNDALKNMVSQVKSLGWLCGLYTNYTDFSPINKNWNEDWLRIDENGNWVSSWFACYSVKPMIAWQEQMKFAPVIHQRYGTNHCYCDVHTAVSPFDRVDYDSRVPGAATFRRTFEAYGTILLRERQAHKGPVYSEGGNHWWYAGLVDGGYANAWPTLSEQPLFPDFDLLKIHPLQMDAGNVTYVFDGKMNDAHIPLTLAYGHICQLTPYNEAESMKRYYLIQPIQPYYTMIPVKSILYWDGNKFMNTSEALASETNLKGKVYLEYENGFKSWVNAGKEDWQIDVNGKSYILPPNGFYAASADGMVESYSVLMSKSDGSGKVQVDYGIGPDSCYIDTRGEYIVLDKIAGNGSVALKKENSGWELIPAREFEEIGFAPSIIGLKDGNIEVEGLDSNGLTSQQQPDVRWNDGKLWIKPGQNKSFKYRLVPVTGMKSL